MQSAEPFKIVATVFALQKDDDGNITGDGPVVDQDTQQATQLVLYAHEFDQLPAKVAEFFNRITTTEAPPSPAANGRAERVPG